MANMKRNAFIVLLLCMAEALFAQQEITDAAEKRFLLHGKKHLQSQVWTASEVFIHSVA